MTLGCSTVKYEKTVARIEKNRSQKKHSPGMRRGRAYRKEEEINSYSGTTPRMTAKISITMLTIQYQGMEYFM